MYLPKAFLYRIRPNLIEWNAHCSENFAVLANLYHKNTTVLGTYRNWPASTKHNSIFLDLLIDQEGTFYNNHENC